MSTPQKHIEQLYAALGIMFITAVVIILVLAFSGSYAWDAGFAAGQEYEAWFCFNTLNP